MSRRDNQNEAVMAYSTDIERIIAEKGEVTLKALATVFDLPPVRFYSVAKTPKEGEIFDPKVYNWEAIQKFVNRRLGQTEDGPTTLEEVIERAVVITQEQKEADGRRASNRGSAAGKKIEVDGKMIPERKFTNFAMLNEDGTPTGNLVVLRKDPAVYKMVYQTLSHTVLVPVSDREGTVASQKVKVISNSMLNMRGMGPANTEIGIEKRFNGEFLKEHPELAPDFDKTEAEAPTAE